jgi:hypothetical protein
MCGGADMTPPSNVVALHNSALRLSDHNATAIFNSILNKFQFDIHARIQIASFSKLARIYPTIHKVTQSSKCCSTPRQMRYVSPKHHLF